MATLKNVEEQIFAKEGFRVKLLPFEGKARALPAYEFEYMARSTWTVSEWQSARMQQYVALLRGVDILRADGERAKMTARLGKLRDGYFDAFCGGEG